MGMFWQDVRHSIRILGRERGFTAVALLTLALGIGATTAIFSVVNAVLLRPFPYDEPDDLMVVWERNTGRGLPHMFASPPNFADWRGMNRAFEEMGVFAETSFFVSGEGEPVRLHGARVTADLLSMLGVAPELGRGLTPEDDRPEAEAVALISHRLWRGRYGVDSALVGRSIEINEEPHTVVGVMPPGFDFPPPIVTDEPVSVHNADIWVPFAVDMAAASRGAHYLTVLGRLRPGIDRTTAEADLQRVARQLQEQHPESNAGWDVTLVPLAEQVVGATRPQLLVLLGAVAFVLLIACVNVANLMLARGTVRGREFAIRAALGASSGRLIRLNLTESLLLGLAGGALGLLVAFGALEALLRLAPQNVPRLDEATLDGRVLAFAAMISLLTAALFGLAPALQAFGVNMSQRLREGGRGGTEGRSAMRLRSSLVVSEMALALVLLVGAGLLFQSLLRLRGVDAGFQAEGALSVRMTLPSSRYPDEPRRVAAFRELGQRLNAAAGVERASFVLDVPLTADRQGTGFTIEGEPPPPPGLYTANFSVVTPGYFQAIGLPLIAGRDFRQSDREGAESVAVVNRTLVRLYFPGGDPIGRHLLLGGQGPVRVVGVVGDVRHTRLRDEPTPVFYLPYAQAPWYGSMSLVARGSVPIDGLLGVVRGTIREFDPAIPLYDVKTMEQVMSESLAELRFSSLLMGVFSLVAALLGAVGIYGVLSYSVSRRRQETGIRMVLGARGSDVLRLIVGQGLRLAVVGVVAGLFLSLLLARALTGLLYGVSPTDPLTLAGMALLLLAAAALASWVPARRATRVDPAAVMRAE